jgi:hypothetical protein
MGERSAVNTWRNWAARILHSDAPKASDAKRKRPSSRQGGVMQIIAIFVQISQKILVVFSPEAFEEFGTRFRDIHATNGLFVAQGFACGAVIRAKPSVRFHRGAIHMKGKNIR